MTVPIFLLGALFAAPLLSQTQKQTRIADPQLRKGKVVWFSLTESRATVENRIGPPVAVADFGDDFQAWHYHLANEDHHDFSHYLVFRRSTDRLVSVTRVWEEEQIVDHFFPESATSACFADQMRSFGARVRKLPHGRILIAMGSTASGRPTSQLMLIAESELLHFHKWLYDAMALPSAAVEVHIPQPRRHAEDPRPCRAALD